jgi:hypothetical protein
VRTRAVLPESECSKLQGDSFIVAFHSANTAVAFSSE